MAVTLREICIVFYCLLSNTKPITADCNFYGIQRAEEGQACEHQEYKEISVPERRHCTLACTYRKECKAIVYDSRRSMCMLLLEPCMLLRPRSDHVYQTFQRPCTKWVSSNDSHGYWIDELGLRSYIGRRFVNHDLVVGKVTDKFHAIRPNDTTYIGGENYGKLVVDASCRVAWVSYDATSGQSMPTGAMVGGFLAATNIPLYVSRLPLDNINLVGYFNPLNHRAWADYYGPKNGTRFDIMVIQPPSILI